VEYFDKYPLVGLFAGVGGIELGFARAGFKTIFANEFDENASTTYRQNHEQTLVTRDIGQLQLSEIPRMGVLTGGFPCQAFSVAGYRKGFTDPRGNLFWEIIRIVDSKKPEVIFLENVKNLGSHDHGKTFKIIKEALKDSGYYVKHAILNASSYSGIPQNRERIYIVGFRKKKFAEAFAFPAPTPSKFELSKFIDFEKKVPEEFYYRENRYMFEELNKHISSNQTVYQWRRHYVRENKSGECPTLTANMGTGGHNVPLILSDDGIRKLTPRECFNLMGFPKTFKLPSTLANSHLYKQAGNAVVVPVITRIAENIGAVLAGTKLPSTGAEQSLLFQ
jgi:DNA (cytosine-5)-methyltransferase 1